MRPDEINAAGSRRGRLAWFVTRESLVIYYFVHVCVLYGSIWNIGLGQAIGPSLALLPTLTWAAVLVTAMALLAWLWHECKRWSDGPGRPRSYAHGGCRCVRDRVDASWPP